MSDLPKLRKARLKRSQRNSDEFHMMLGYCIVAWADVDEMLFRIFCSCVGPYEQCAILYYRTPGLDVRFKTTDEIVRSVFPKKEPGKHDHPSIAAWNRTINGHGDLLAVRRRLAHHPTSVRMNIGARGVQFPDGTITPFSWVESHMSDHEKRRGQAGHDKRPLLYRDLENHYVAVGALANRLLSFLIEVLSKPRE